MERAKVSCPWVSREESFPEALTVLGFVDRWRCTLLQAAGAMKERGTPVIAVYSFLGRGMRHQY